MKNSKQFAAILILAILGMSFTNKIIQNDRILGEWKGTDKAGKTNSIIFDKTNHAIFILDGEVLGGEEFEMKGRKAECKFEIDYTKNPIWLDIVIYINGDTLEYERVKGIVRFINDNKIEYRICFKDSHCDKFDTENKDETIILDRVIK